MRAHLLLSALTFISAFGAPGTAHSSSYNTLFMISYPMRKLGELSLDQKFLVAARRGDISDAKRFLRQGADLHALDQLQAYHPLRGTMPPPATFVEGWTPLHWAVARGQKKMVAFLLEMGAVAEVKDSAGHTALSIAVVEGRFDLIPLLIRAGANVNHMDQAGYTPLRLAAECAARQRYPEHLYALTFLNELRFQLGIRAKGCRKVLSILISYHAKAPIEQLSLQAQKVISEVKENLIEVKKRRIKALEGCIGQGDPRTPMILPQVLIQMINEYVPEE